MRLLGIFSHPTLPRNERVTTWWQGNIAASTWSSRNVSSVTESGSADITITFLIPYVATPAALVTAATNGVTTLQGSFSSITATSIRAVSRNSANAAAVGRSSSVICVGEL